jgi:glucan phosphoethanolaminetransferase (alkaline phosphatase superfamily)
MKSIDQFNIILIIICTIIYIILCLNTKYKNIINTYDTTSNQSENTLTDSDYKMLYLTTVFGFIYGAILISFQQRYLIHSITSLWIWVLILFISILLVFSAFYSQVFVNENPNSFMNKFSYAIVPILPSLVILSESAISEVLESGFNLNHVVDIYSNVDNNTEQNKGGYFDSNKTEEFWYLSEN